MHSAVLTFHAIAQALSIWPFPFLFGLAVAVVVGHKPISRLSETAWDSLRVINEELPNPRAEFWPPKAIGIIERTLFVGSLYYGYKELIAAWLALKVAGGYKQWSEDGLYFGRSLFNVFMIGNAASLAYAFLGFKAIGWLSNAELGKTLFYTILLTAFFERLRFQILRWKSLENGEKRGSLELDTAAIAIGTKCSEDVEAYSQNCNNMK